MMSKWKRRAGAIVFGSMISLAGLMSIDIEPAAQASVADAAPPAEVSIQKVASGMLEAPVRLTGELRALRSARVRAEISGRVLEMPWRLGDRLQAGEVLARLDGSKNDLARRQADARVVQGEVALEQARRKRARSQALFDLQKISVERYDDAVFAHRRAEAELELRRAELATLERIAEDHLIRAPYDAFISEIAVEQGDFAAAGSHAFSLVHALGMKVSFQVPAEHVSSFERGAVHPIEIPALGRTFDATVAAIGKEADARSRTFEIELDLVPEADLHPGMIAKLSTKLDSGVEGLFVPGSAVIEKFGGSFVFVYEDGVAREIPVTIDLRDADRVAISGPLDETTWVIAAGQHRLETGARVVASSSDLRSSAYAR
jgi:RND family efflux transporter MFP subunit